MSKLPPALAAWDEQLRIFPPEVALSLGPWLPRLALALGPLRSRASAGDADPDGYDGLSRRGSYERLLVSEWLFALEAPDEFVRRAAMGEHGFLQLARRSPTGSRRSIALFDAGPAQLGTPRIAHLAALIVLARRAVDAGAEFSWGILQRPELPAVREVSAASVLGLLGGRSAHEVSDAQLARWRLAIGPTAGDDLWLVGPRRLGSRPGAQGVSLLAVEDVLRPDAREVAVEILGGPGARRVVLGLPPPDDCVRLLRDPFAVTATGPRSSGVGPDVGGGLLFTPTGRRLAFREAGGALVFHAIPGSPRAQPELPKRLLPARGRWLMAAGWHGNGLLAVESDGTQLWLHGHGGRGRGRGPRRVLSPAGPIAFAHPPPGAPLLPVIRAGGAKAQALHTFVPDADGRLWGFSLELEGTVVPVTSRMLAFTGVGSGSAVVLVGDRPGGPGSRLLSLAGMVELPWAPGEEEITAAHFGYGGQRGQIRFGFLATRGLSGHWSVHMHGRTAHRDAPEAEVIGVARDNRAEGMPVLVGLDRETCRLELLSTGGWSRRLPDASGPIVAARSSAASAQLAWITRSGEVAVYSLDRDAVVLRLVPGPPP